MVPILGVLFGPHPGLCLNLQGSFGSLSLGLRLRHSGHPHSWHAAVLAASRPVVPILLYRRLEVVGLRV